MLESTEREIVVRVLRDNIFILGSNPGALLQPVIGATLAAQIIYGPTAEATTTAVVRFCEDQDWRAPGDHPLIDLIKIVERIDPAIPPIIARLRAIPLPSNPLDSELLECGTIFLGRSLLRKALVPDLLKETGICILRVNGDSRWGKSYTFKFLKFLNQQRKPLTPVFLENPGPATRAEEIADTLVQRMAALPVNKPNIAGETPLRAGQLLADWVLNIALRTPPSNWWFVLDDFDVPGLPEDSKEFIRQLALQIANGLGRKTIRLILFNYYGDLHRDLRRLQAKDDVPNNVTSWLDLVKDYYDRMALRNPAKTPLIVQRRDNAVLQLSTIPADRLNNEFMQILAERLEDDTDVLSA